MALADLNHSPRCQHVHYSGRPCKAPARRGRNYCVFHQAAHLDPGGCVLPIIEDVHSYQLAIIRIARALADDVIDSKKATALLYALQLAGTHLKTFADQRKEIEDPTASLKNEIAERYQARRYPFPSYIDEKDLVPILQDMAAEHRADSRVVPNDNVEIIPCAISPEPASPVILSDEARERSERAGESKDPVFPPRTPASPAVKQPATIDKLEACAEPLDPRESASDFSLEPRTSNHGSPAPCAISPLPEPRDIHAQSDDRNFPFIKKVIASGEQCLRSIRGRTPCAAC